MFRKMFKTLLVDKILRHVELGPNVHGGSQAMQPGSWLFAAIVAGGRLLIAGPGEQLEIHATQPLWARIHLPEASAAAEYGCAPGVQVLLEGATGGAWMWERPPRCPRGGRLLRPLWCRTLHHRQPDPWTHASRGRTWGCEHG